MENGASWLERRIFLRIVPASTISRDIPSNIPCDVPPFARIIGSRYYVITTLNQREKIDCLLKTGEGHKLFTFPSLHWFNQTTDVN